MNEQIIELAKQAGVSAQSETTLHPNQVKFAELVIQEAILAVKMKTNTHHIHTTFDEGMVLHTINNSVRAIKEHFGVKE